MKWKVDWEGEVAADVAATPGPGLGGALGPHPRR